MKIDRRIKFVRPIVETLCNKYALVAPVSIQLMKDYCDRLYRSSGSIEIRQSNKDFYIIKVRLHKQELVADQNGSYIFKDNPNEKYVIKQVLRSREEIIKTVCHEMAHLIYHDHSPSHAALSSEMFNLAMEKQ